MKKTIMITGSTDGIGLETAKLLIEQGHHLIVHGRNMTKLQQVRKHLLNLRNDAQVSAYCADLSKLEEVKELASQVIQHHESVDILINNAGVYKTQKTTTELGIDVRFVVNTIAPYLLTNKLIPYFSEDARVINLSSAAQASVNVKALTGEIAVSDDMSAYAQSKLALVMWSFNMAASHKRPVIISLNPGSLLASKMVKEGFGVAGNDLSIGANIIVKAAISDEFNDASGLYYDNDQQAFAAPHHEALTPENNSIIEKTIQLILNNYQ